ncbi:MAG: DUF3800 domain-containing protein [Corynebacterium sp.]|uniref:DUF3800 domain-containing protein n=1 Tax=Corynebacterium sp. TaxID=1720 RepID=UPI0026E0969E|nr:DUF3800 domain-containing protein [Corynebacterium sp.]MDO5670226.1 DUF3800 domain-containing protein [Corynebacterium sp.]
MNEISSGTSHPSTSFVFLDESGDMQFGPRGSQHFVLTAVYTVTPAISAFTMQSLKYSLLAAGSEDVEFHATNNSRGTRKRVIDTIGSIDCIGAHTLWIDKTYTHPKLQDEISLLGQFGKSMGRWIYQTQCRPEFSQIEQVVLVFDSVLTGKKQAAFLKLLKPQLGALPIPYRVLFHPVKQDLNGQIADYFSWAWYRKVERGDPEHARELMSLADWSEFNLFQSGHTPYWSRNQ